MTEMIKNIKSLENKFTLCRTDIDKLQDCASQVPKELFSATAKRAGGGRVRTQFFLPLPLEIQLCTENQLSTKCVFLIGTLLRPSSRKHISAS